MFARAIGGFGLRGPFLESSLAVDGSSKDGPLSTSNWNPLNKLLTRLLSERPFDCCGESFRGGLDLELPLLAPEPKDSFEEVDSVGV